MHLIKSRFFIKVPLRSLFVIACLLLYLTSAEAKSKNSEYNWFWCFYEAGNYTNQTYSVYRPFYMKNDYGSRQFYASLMPIFYWRTVTRQNDHIKGLLGFYESSDYTHAGNVRDYDIGIFPFYYYGSSPKEKDSYRLIWPIGGNLKEKFGYDHISPWIFPGFLLFVFYPPASILSWQTGAYMLASILPVYVTFKEREYKAWSLLWPLIYHGKSSVREETRILPFYAHVYKKDYYDNYQYLLLFNYQQYFYRKDVHRTFFFFPLFGKKWSGTNRRAATTILWPFFSWGYDARSGTKKINFPWPLVQIEDSFRSGVYKRIFFPFYGVYKKKSSHINNETLFVTPLYFTLKKESHRFKSERYYTCLIVWYYKRDYFNKPDSEYGKHWRYFKIWPLFNYEWSDNGSSAFNLLSLLPMRDTDGYERLYQPFWSLVEYRRNKDERHLGLLLRLYYQRWGKDFFQMRIPLLLTYESEENTLTDFSFLLSMFGYEHRNDGRYLKLFWIPLRIGDSTKKVAKKRIKSNKIRNSNSTTTSQASVHLSDFNRINTLANKCSATYSFF